MSDENTVNEVAPEIISEARAQGWVPKEEFRDDEAKWVDADTFVKRGREINPILRKHNQELKAEISRVRQQAEEAIATAKEFTKFQEENYKRKLSELDGQIEQLKTAKRDAITSGDGDRAVAIDDAIDNLREEKSSLKKPEPPAHKRSEGEVQIAPEVQTWMNQNEWYGRDVEDTELTNALAASLRKEFPSLIGNEFFVKLDERIKTRGIGPKRQKPANPVEGNSGTRSSSGGKKSFSDLPSEAKAACDRYVKQGLFKNREEYLAVYEWE